MGPHGTDESPRLREHRLRRGLTQQEVAEGIERLAWVQASRRVGVNADMVSKWERGRKTPSRFYLRLLCSFFEVDPEALGLMTGPPAGSALESVSGFSEDTADLVAGYAAMDQAGLPVELLQPKMLELWREDLLSRRQVLRLMGAAPAVGGLEAIETTLSLMPASRALAFRGSETVGKLEVLQRRLEVLYHSSAPRKLLFPVRSLIGTAEDLLPDVRVRTMRQPLLDLLARANLLAGRLLFFDLHEPLLARAHLDLAREAAQEADGPVLASVVFGHMAFLPAEKRNVQAAMSYLDAARGSLSREPTSMVAAWISAVESEIGTKAGATSQALMSLAQAESELAGSSSALLPEWFDFFDARRLHGFQGFALRKAGDLASARAHLEAALSPGQQVTPKQRSVSMIDLAVTCVEDGDVDAGCALATNAAMDLRRAGYATAVDRLTEFQAVLPDQRHPAARLLRESVAELS